MADCYKALQQMPINDRPTLDQFVAQMAEAEQQYRKLRPTAKRTRHRIYPALVDMTTLVRLTVPFFSMRARSS